MASPIRIRSGRRRHLYLKEWRKHRKLTQEKLADRLETSAATVSRMEKRAREPNVGYLEALADALDCEPQDFYRPPTNPFLDDEVRNAPPEKQEQIKAVVMALLRAS